MKKSIVISLFVFPFILLSPSLAHANTLWQVLFFQPQYMWLIPVTLGIEYFLVQKLLIKDLLKAFKITIYMNFFSFLIGIFIMIPTLFVRQYRNTLTGVLLAFYSYFVLYVVNALLETMVVKNEIKTRPFLYVFWPVFLANFITVSLSLLAVRD